MALRFVMFSEISLPMADFQVHCSKQIAVMHIDRTTMTLNSLRKMFRCLLQEFLSPPPMHIRIRQSENPS